MLWHVRIISLCHYGVTATRSPKPLRAADSSALVVRWVLPRLSSALRRDDSSSLLEAVAAAAVGGGWDDHSATTAPTTPATAAATRGPTPAEQAVLAEGVSGVLSHLSDICQSPRLAHRTLIPHFR